MDFVFEYRDVDYKQGKVRIPIPPYNYQPLPEAGTHFRLLRVSPSDVYEAPITCTLNHYLLDDPPFYSAVSYQWGNPTDWTVIEIDGTKFPIGFNLDKALRQFRRRRCPLLWIDAICINQQNIEEKSAQIPRMREIYHRAECVAAWIGDESDGDEKALEMLRAIEISRRPSPNKTQLPWTPNSQVCQKYQRELQAFFQRSFWRRVWIIQEITSGSRVVIFCGSMIAYWEALEVLLDILDADLVVNTDVLGYVRHLVKTRISRIEGHAMGLLQALSDSRYAEASVLHDKIFALLGLTFDGQEFIRSPSYGIKGEEICYELTKSVIWAKKSLDIIFAAAPSMKLPGQLPSWIPDYLRFCSSGHPEVLANLSIYLSGNERRYRAGRLAHRWNSTGQSVVTRLAVKIDGHMLRIQGFCFGTINGLGAVLTDDRLPQQSLSSTATSGKTDAQLAMDLSAAYTFYDKEYERHKSELRMASYVWYFPNLREYDTHIKKDLTRQFQTVLRWTERNKMFLVRGKSLEKRASSLDFTERRPLAEAGAKLVGTAAGAFAAGVAMSLIQPGKRLLPSPQIRTDTRLRPPADLVAALENFQSLINEGLRIMTTEEDHVGWAHPASEIGDQLFLLTGCSMPAVLRPSQNRPMTYCLVGHAYVHGVMDNEIWSQLPSNQLQEIVLN